MGQNSWNCPSVCIVNRLYFYEQVGDEGAGHFVKMVHNGIEYGDMQLICEAYHILRKGVGMTNDEIADVSSAHHEFHETCHSVTFIVSAALRNVGAPVRSHTCGPLRPVRPKQRGRGSVGGRMPFVGIHELTSKLTYLYYYLYIIS